MKNGVIMKQETKDLLRYQLPFYIKKVAQNHIIIHREKIINGKPT
jgi:hypothetical protein